MYSTLPMLLEAINTVAKRPSATELERIGLKGARDTYRRIGVELVCQYRWDDFEVRNTLVARPREIVKIEDVGPEGAQKGQGYRLKSQAMSLQDQYAYYETPFDIRFPNLLNTGKIRLFYYGFHTDQNGELYILEEAFEACKLMGQYHALEGQYDHPEYPKRDDLLAKSLNEISTARGDLNRSSAAQNRTERRLL